MVKVAYTVGRFQPPTLGHIRMIDELLTRAAGAPAYVFISSAKDSLIPSAMKKEYLEKMLTRGGVFPKNLTLIDTATCSTSCGGPLGGWGYIKETLKITGPDVLLFVGSDQKDKFTPKDTGMWGTVAKEERPSIAALERSGPGAATYSSTKAREAVASSGSSGLKPFLTDETNAITDSDVERMNTALLDVKAKWPTKKGGAMDYDSVFDEDIDGGRRAKTRRKRRLTRLTRSKASSKALYRRGSRSRNGS
jgi:hypothetical protein